MPHPGRPRSCDERLPPDGRLLGEQSRLHRGPDPGSLGIRIPRQELKQEKGRGTRHKGGIGKPGGIESREVPYSRWNPSGLNSLRASRCFLTHTADDGWVET